MATREEITKILYGVALGGIQPTEALQQLSDLGVVIKVERELPENPYALKRHRRAPHTSTQLSYQDMGRGYQRCIKMVKDAGYVAVKTLIEEGNDGKKRG